MAINSRRVVHRSLFVLFVGWAVYASILVTGYFLSGLPKYRGESAWLILVALACAVVLSGERPASRAPSRAARMSVRQFGVLVAAFSLVALALYGASLSFGLFSDDFALLDRAARHEFLARAWHLRPLPLVVWALASNVPGTSAALHAVNLLLHAANAAFVVLLARRLGLSAVASVCAGALFICFPAAVEAVAWPSGIQDVLATTCCLVFVLTAGFAERPDLVTPLSMAALAAALMSKETAVVAPVLACAAWLGRKDRWNPRPIVWGLVLVVAYLVLRLTMFAADSGFFAVPSHYFAKELISRLFSALAVPFAGSELARFPVLGALTAWLFAALLLLGVLDACRDRDSAIRFVRCAICVLLPALPVWAAFFVSADLQGSRYLYLPACGWCILVAALLVERQTKLGRALGGALAVVLLVAGGLGVRSHLRDWQEAASVRDEVLASAVSRLQTTPCAVVRFTQVPDSVRGAYVFRNGFLEALAGRGAPSTKATMIEPVEAACTLEWRDGAFR